MIDSRAPRFNQAVVGVVSVLAVLTGWWWLLALLAAQLAIGLTFGRRFCLPCLAYFELVQPRFGEGPLEDSRPPRVANMVGIAVLGAASIAYAAGWAAVGAGLGLLVAALALIAAITGFCTGLRGVQARLPADRAAVRLVPAPSDAGSMNWQLSLAGLLIGLLVGMTGMGGGSLMTPLLVLVFGFKPTVAIGTDILHGAIFKSFGAWRHRSLGTVHAHLTLWMLLGSAPASIAGVAFATWLGHRYGDGFEETAAHILGAALIVGGLGFLVKTFVTGNEKTDAPFLLARHDKVIALLTGIGGGFVVGLTSVGSGTFFGLVMLLVFPLTAVKVVGTDIFHAAALLWVAGASHLVAGNVDLGATAWLLVGSIPGVLIGSQVTVKLPERLLRVGLATVLTLSGVKLLDAPTIVLPIVLAAGLALLATIALRPPPRVQPERS